MPPRHQQAGGRPRRLAAAAVLAAAALAVGGCSSSGSSTPASGSSGSPGGGAPPLPTTVTIGHVAGTTRAPFRHRFHQHAHQLRTEVGKAVDAWIDGAFVGVHYPAHQYPDAFTSFTAQARSEATRQANLTTMGSLGSRIDGVEPLVRTVALDVLAPHGKAAGVTARVLLRLRTTGHTTKKVTVTGRLFLTRSASGAWQVFGFDLAKGTK